MKNTKLLMAIALGVALVGCQSKPKGDAEAAPQASTGTNESAGMNDTSASSSEASKALLSTTVFYFDFDQAVIKPEAFEALQAHATFLAGNPSSAIRLEGHADEQGTREYNVALGERRAKAVESFLLSNGAQAGQIEVISYGEERPVDAGHNESSWSKNRRVELIYK